MTFLKWLVRGLFESRISRPVLLAREKLLEEIKAGIGSKIIHNILTVEGVILKKKSLQSEGGVLGIAVSDHTA
ncbi:MAG: hypothetical protein ACYSR7_04370 [Planctomycetota bacterium]|jgi:hypothetical protein